MSRDPMPAQLTFDGRVVAALAFKFGDLDLDYVPEGLAAHDLGSLSLGDEVLAEVRFKLEAVGHDEKVDRLGAGAKPLTRKVQFKMLKSGFAVKALLTRADI